MFCQTCLLRGLLRGDGTPGAGRWRGGPLALRARRRHAPVLRRRRCLGRSRWGAVWLGRVVGAEAAGLAARLRVHHRKQGRRLHTTSSVVFSWLSSIECVSLPPVAGARPRGGTEIGSSAIGSTLIGAMDGVGGWIGSSVKARVSSAGSRRDSHASSSAEMGGVRSPGRCRALTAIVCGAGSVAASCTRDGRGDGWHHRAPSAAGASRRDRPPQSTAAAASGSATADHRRACGRREFGQHARAKIRRRLDVGHRTGNVIERRCRSFSIHSCGHDAARFRRRAT